MKKLRTFIAACILVLSLSVVGFADGGVTQTPGSTNPPPPPPNGPTCAVAIDPEPPANNEVCSVATEFASLMAYLAVSFL